jgi:hypothetical protein
MIDKYIEIVKEHFDEMIHKAITVKYENEELKILQTIIKEQQKELETYKKIAEFLAKKIVGVIQYDYIYENICINNPNYVFCENIGNHIKCKQCLLEHARKEVEKDV